MKELLKGVKTDKRSLSILLIPLSFFLTEVFAFLFLGLDLSDFSGNQLWPLAFAACWALILSAVVLLLPCKIARVVYGLLYFAGAVYAGFQTGYYVLFKEMMWLSEFRYASEGADYASVLLSYPIGWWIGIFAMIIQGLLLLWKFPRWKLDWKRMAVACLAIVLAVVGAAAFALIRAKKRGVKCIGCPDSGSCSGNCGCSCCNYCTRSNNYCRHGRLFLLNNNKVRFFHFFYLTFFMKVTEF